MEYVVVSYAKKRDVFIDGQRAGKTGDTLMVETGTHFFDLGAPQDYVPAKVARAIKDTTTIDPMLIEDFHPAASVL
jgi:hypothetical protein